MDPQTLVGQRVRVGENPGEVAKPAQIPEGTIVQIAQIPVANHRFWRLLVKLDGPASIVCVPPIRHSRHVTKQFEYLVVDFAVEGVEALFRALNVDLSDSLAVWRDRAILLGPSRADIDITKDSESLGLFGIGPGYCVLLSRNSQS
jgi:hypothetical protein